MARIINDFKIVVFISFILITITFFNCGGDSIDSSTNSSSPELSRIDGRITEVLALKIDEKQSHFAEIKNTLSFTVTATAQGSLVDGISVMAIGNDSNGEKLLDQDTTAFDGSFSLFVPAGEVALQFEVDNEVYEKVLQVPEETTVEILVSINKEDKVNPVEISGPDGDGEEENTEDAIDETEDNSEDLNNENDVPQPEDTNDMQDEDEQTGDDDDDNQGDIDPPSSGEGNITSAELLTSLNSRRAQGANCGSEGSFGPQGPLSISSALGEAALRHSIDMSENNFFDHRGSDGSGPIDRMRAAGFNGNGWGENISRASYERSDEEVVAGWMTSDGHCSNIMTPGFNVLGSAKAANSNWENWTLNLGTE